MFSNVYKDDKQQQQLLDCKILLVRYSFKDLTFIHHDGVLIFPRLLNHLLPLRVFSPSSHVLNHGQNIAS